MIYDYSDKIMKLIDKKLIKLFNDFVADFDELTIFKDCVTMYKNIDKISKKYLTELARKVYLDNDGDRDTIEEIDLMVDYFFLKPDPVTKYALEKELERKRNRLAESLEVTANPDIPESKSQIQTNVKKEVDIAKKYVSKMVSQYADNITLRSFVIALESKGVKHVRWRSENDERTCEECRDLDNKVFPITDIPPKPHWGCRCWIEPVE